jgi:Transposase domain (DUF772)
MRLVRHLQHWLGGTGLHLEVTDFVPDSHPIRLWADTFPWDDMVAAIEQSMERRFPKTSARGRPGVSVRVLLALELLKHELTCSDEAICDRLRTDFAVMYACSIREVHVNRDQIHFVIPETLSTFRARLDEELIQELLAIQLMFKGLRASPSYFSESRKHRRSEGAALVPGRPAHGGLASHETDKPSSHPRSSPPV